MADIASGNAPMIHSSSTLRAKNLYFSAGRRLLIDDVSLELKSGEMVVLIGPNGAGKSTLLRLLTGFLQPDQGHCELQGQALADWPPQALARTRAVMRQSSELAFGFSVRQIITLGRAPHAKTDNDEALHQVMVQTDCLALADRDYRQLSGGEQQRVQLARVLSQLWQAQPSPRWLFLDEPTSALDLYHQQHTLRLLHQLTRETPLSVCCVMHDLNLAALYANRIILLHEGRVVASGTPADVLTAEILARGYQADLGVTWHPEMAVPQVFLRQ